MNASYEFYEMLAPVYDSLNRDVNYEKMAAYVQKTAGRFLPSAPKVIVDLGCGTGSLSLHLADMAEQVIAIDGSPEMLCMAQAKAAEQGKKLTFLCQDITAFSAGVQADLIVCSMDTLNHLTNEKQVAGLFARAAKTLKPGGLFLFDLNTPYKHEVLLGNRTVIRESESAFCVWENEYCPESGKVKMLINLFAGSFEKGYVRDQAEQTERLILVPEIEGLLVQNGFVLKKQTADYTTRKPNEKTTRICYVLQKE